MNNQRDEMMGCPSGEETSLLWGHHHDARQKRHGFTYLRRRVCHHCCIRASMCSFVAVAFGLGLVCLFPGSVNKELPITDSPGGFRVAKAYSGEVEPRQMGMGMGILPGTAGPAGSKSRIGIIEKSMHDAREYRALSLENGMKALLVSDSQSSCAAAAVDVAVGTWNDPQQVPLMLLWMT